MSDQHSDSDTQGPGQDPFEVAFRSLSKINERVDQLLGKIQDNDVLQAWERLNDEVVSVLRKARPDLAKASDHRRVQDASRRMGEVSERFRKAYEEHYSRPAAAKAFDQPTENMSVPADAPGSAARRKPERIAVQHLTIVGDRQHGKSHALITLAMEAASNDGRNVYYECDGSRMIDERMIDFQRRYGRRIQKILRSRGSRRIVFGDRDGGESMVVYFELPREHRAIHVHVLDDVPYAEPLESARLVIRSVLR